MKCLNVLGRMGAPVIGIGVGAVCLFLPTVVVAQPTADPAAAAPKPDEAAPVEPTAPAAGSQDLSSRLEKLEQRVQAQEQANAELKQQLELKDADIQELRSSQEQAADQERLLQAWGFFDVSFGSFLFDNSRALYRLGLPTTSSFLMNGVNLYLKSDLPSNFSVMVETRLTFTPNGTQTGFRSEAYLGDQQVAAVGEYERLDTTTHNALITLPYRQSGVLIERAHVDWKPHDLLNFRAGRYLTPFGIWNEDHGSPVLLGVDNPQIVNAALVPIWQTGLQAYGGADLTDGLRLDYAATLSNGRGPMDEVLDLDGNKAAGLRAKLVYQTDDWLLRAGGYLYHGRYTDRQSIIKIHVGNDGLLDPTVNPSFASDNPVTSSYDETVVTADAELRYKSLRLLGEIGRRAVFFNVPEPVENLSQLLAGVPVNQSSYYQNYLGVVGYAMAAYEITLPDSLAGLRVTPYAGYDFQSPNSAWKFYNRTAYRGGLNVKPTSNLTLKAEVSRIVPESKQTASNLTIVVGQVAVAF